MANKFKLTEKQKRFADEYLIDLNATQAAARAGYKDPNFGRQLLTKTNVSEYIGKRREILQKKTQITQERVLEEVAKVGFASLTDYLKYRTVMRQIDTEDGEPVYDWAMIVEAIESSEVDGAPIQEVSVGRDGTFKLKLHSKMDALEKLCRYLGLFEQKAESGEVEDLTPLARMLSDD